MSTTFKQHVAPFNAQRLEAISRILGDTEGGLTGTEIGYLLRDSRIPDCSPDMTKWKRLLNAFVTIQNEHQVGNHIKSNPGQGVEQIAKALGTSTKELTLPIRKLLGDKKITSKGQKRATRYFPK